MVEKIAINRTIFVAADIIHSLLEAWDLYDKKVFSSLALRHVFRAMRRVVCDSHTDTIIEVRRRGAYCVGGSRLMEITVVDWLWF